MNNLVVGSQFGIIDRLDAVSDVVHVERWDDDIWIMLCPAEEIVIWMFDDPLLVTLTLDQPFVCLTVD